MKLHHLLLITIFSIVHSTLHSQIQGTWHSNFQVAGKSLLMDLQIEGVGRDGVVIVSIPDQPQPWKSTRCLAIVYGSAGK
jgi:hypothetical protein